MLLIDVIIVAAIAYFLLGPLNTRRGWRYVSGIVIVLLLLVGSDLVHLHGLHLISQGLLIALVIALPILFHQEWTELLSRSATPAPVTAPPYVSAVVLGAVAVVMATLVVFAASGVTTKTGELPDQVMVKAVNLGDGLSASLGSKRSVNVIISAPRHTWQGLTSDSFSASVDIANQKEGTYDLAVHVESKVPDVKVLRVVPDHIVVAVEPLIRKTVPVVVKFDGQAGNDLIPDTPIINPDKVEITGAKSVIDTITQVIARVKLNGETGNLEQTATLTVEDSSGEIIAGVGVSASTATVKVALVKAGKVKTVGIKASFTGQPKSGLWPNAISVEPATVAVTGSVDQLDSLTSIATASINLDGHDSSFTTSVELSLPQGITVADNTQKVTVKISLAANDTTRSLSPQISYKGLDSSLQVQSLTPSSITVVVSGLADLLNKTSGGDVGLLLDLSAYKSAGTYSVTIKNADFTLPENISLASFLPSAISVTLSAK